MSNNNNNYCPEEGYCSKDGKKCDFNSYINDIIEKFQDMSVYLVNGIRLDGKITGYDPVFKCIWICNAVNQNKPQVIFFSAISTISFAKLNVNKFTENNQNSNNMNF